MVHVKLAKCVEILKGAVLTTAALAFLAGSFLCCCSPKLVHAAPAKSCCHKQAKTDPVKTCDHCSLKAPAAESVNSLQGAVPQWAKSFSVLWVADFVAFFRPADLHAALACASPPVYSPSIPLYLKHANLRL